MIECVPNISEGIRCEIIDRLIDAARREGGTLLDLHMDADHHRSVLTLVGSPERMVASMVALTERAIEAIDLRDHSGVHPRMGAVDVMPFVPLSANDMPTCIRAARRVGEALGRRLDLPVYLYERAALRPDRRNLAHVRRGGIAGVAERIRTKDGRPDFGPQCLHPTAGAIAVGARAPLVAYNIMLRSDDLAGAREIARRIRASSSGGLPGVKALGLALPRRRCVQVSMNLTDIRETDIPTAFSRVAREAHDLELRIGRSEIVGLAPRMAFGTATADEILLQEEIADKTLEERLIHCGVVD